MYQKLEDNRNEIADRILRLETDLNKLKTEKDERDSKISSLVRDKQVLMSEHFIIDAHLFTIFSGKCWSTGRIKTTKPRKDENFITIGRSTARIKHISCITSCFSSI